MNDKVIIAIDPDSTRSGVAILDIAARRFLTIDTLPFPALIDTILDTVARSDTPDEDNTTRVDIIIEAAWQGNRANFHTMAHTNIRTAARQGYDIGRNHETGRKIYEMLEYHTRPLLHVHLHAVPPLRKCWHGQGGKITQQEITALIPHLPARLNQEARDAVLLAWTAATSPSPKKTAATSPSPKKTAATSPSPKKTAATTSTRLS